MAVDPHYANISLLLHCDGLDGYTTFTDSSFGARVATRLGGAAISTGRSVFGGASLRLGTAGDGLSFAAGAHFNHGTGDYTIEFRVYRDATSGSYTPLVTQYVSVSVLGVLLQITDAGKIRFRAGDGPAVDITGATTITAATQHHIAVSRESGVTRLFVNGVLDASSSLVADIASNENLNIGNGVIVGNFDEVCITKGVARYTANFTPPTAAYEAPTPLTLTAELSLPGLRFSTDTGANAPLLLPSLSFYSGDTAHVQAALVLPILKAVSHGPANAALTGTFPSLIAIGHNSAGENNFTYAVPAPTLTAFAGANAKLVAPTPTLAIAATVVNWGAATLTAPASGISASGTVSGTAQAGLAPPAATLIGYGGAVCSITLRGRPTIQATGTTGSIGGTAITCPLFELTASATAQNYGSANLLSPSAKLGATAQAWLIAPGAMLTAVGTAVIAVSYEAYAVNLGHRNPQATTNEVTRYTNFPFTHVVRYQNSYYGANSTGLYLLEGTTDEATPIPWSFKTGITDFDDAKQKTVAAAYFGGSMPPATTVTLFEGDKVGVPYAQTTPRGADLQTYRETFARGVKGRYYALGLSGTGKIELDDLDFEIKQLTRRI